MWITEDNGKNQGRSELLSYIPFAAVAEEVGNLHSRDNCHTYWGPVLQEHSHNFHNPEHSHNIHHYHSTGLDLLDPENHNPNSTIKISECAILLQIRITTIQYIQLPACLKDSAPMKAEHFVPLRLCHLKPAVPLLHSS